MVYPINLSQVWAGRSIEAEEEERRQRIAPIPQGVPRGSPLQPFTVTELPDLKRIPGGTLPDAEIDVIPSHKILQQSYQDAFETFGDETPEEIRKDMIKAQVFSEVMQQPLTRVLEEGLYKDPTPNEEINQVLIYREGRFLQTVEAEQRLFQGFNSLSIAVKDKDEKGIAEAKARIAAASKEREAVKDTNTPWYLDIAGAGGRILGGMSVPIINALQGGGRAAWDAAPISDPMQLLRDPKKFAAELIKGFTAPAQVGYGYARTSFGVYHGDIYNELIDSEVDPDFADLAATAVAIPLVVMDVASFGGVGGILSTIPGVKQAAVHSAKVAAKRALQRGTTKRAAVWGGKGAGVFALTEGEEIVQELSQEVGTDLSRIIYQNTRMKDAKNIGTMGTYGRLVTETIKDLGPIPFLGSANVAGVGYIADTIDRKTTERALDQVRGEVEAAEREIAADRPDYRNHPTGAMGDPVIEGNTVADAIPITPEEELKNLTGYDVPIVDEAKFDDLTDRLAAGKLSDADLDAATAEDVQLGNSSGNATADFLAGIRQVAGTRRQSKTFEALYRARARATGRTLDQFVKDLKLSVEFGVDPEHSGAVEFMEDGRTILRAFENTSLVDLTHETGHIFFKDLADVERKKAEKAFGVKDGVWDTEAKERFAGGFAQWMATGKAPNSKMAEIFQRFHTWIGNVAHTVRAASPFNSEMEQIYQDMFVSTMNPEFVQNEEAARQQTEILYSEGPKRPGIERLARTNKKLDKALSNLEQRLGEKYQKASDLNLEELKAEREAVSEGKVGETGTLGDRVKITVIDEEANVLAEMLMADEVSAKFWVKENHPEGLFEITDPDAEVEAEHKPHLTSAERDLSKLFENFDLNMQLASGYRGERDVTRKFDESDAELATRVLEETEGALEIGEDSEEVIGVLDGLSNFIDAALEDVKETEGKPVSDATEAQAEEKLEAVLAQETQVADLVDHVEEIEKEAPPKKKKVIRRVKKKAKEIKAKVDKTVEKNKKTHTAKTKDTKKAVDEFKKAKKAKTPEKVQEHVDEANAAVVKADQRGAAQHPLVPEQNKRKRRIAREKGTRTAKKAKRAIDADVALAAELKTTIREAAKFKKLANQTKDAVKKRAYWAGFNRAKAKYKAQIARKAQGRANTAAKSVVRRRIDRVVNTFKPKKVAGRPKGKYTASFQDQANKILLTWGMSSKGAQVVLENKHTPYDQMTSLEKLENALLRVRADVRNMGMIELKQILEDLTAFREGGRELRLQQLQAIQDEVESVLRASRLSTKELGRRRKRSPAEKDFYDNKVNDFKKALDRGITWSYMDMHAMANLHDMGSDTPLNKGPMAVMFETVDQENIKNEGTRLNKNKVRLSAADIWGIQGKNDKQRIRRADTMLYNQTLAKPELITSVKWVVPDGVNKGNNLGLGDVKLNKAQVRNLYMEFQMDDVRASLEANGWNDTNFQDIEASLSPEDVAFVDAQLEIYADYYDRINEKYRLHNGIDLDKVNSYNPIIRIVTGEAEVSHIEDYLSEMKPNHTLAIGNPNLISRVGSKKMVRVQADFNKMDRYSDQMEHYIAYADWSAKARMFLKDDQWRALTNNYHGKFFRDTFVQAVDDVIQNGSRQNTHGVEKVLATMRNNLAVALTSLKIWQTAKQLASISTYTDKVPIPYLTKYLAEFGSSPRKNWKMMEDMSVLIRNRHSTYNQFMVDAERSGAVSRLGRTLKHPRLMDILTYTTKLGDKGAIVAGMYAHVRYLTEVKGMDQKAAVREAEVFSRNTQQTTEKGSLTPAQRGGIVGRTASMFTKSQQQYAASTMLALAAGRAGRMTKAKAARTAVVIGTLTPMIWQFVAKAFSQDDKDIWDYALAPIDSYFAPVPLLGTTVATVNNWVSKGHNYGRDAITFIPSEQVNDILDDMNTIVSGVGDDLGMEETLAAIDMFSKLANLTGLPGTTSKNILTGAVDAVGAETYQELLQGTMELGGIGPSTAKGHSLVTGKTIYNSE